MAISKSCLLVLFEHLLFCTHITGKTSHQPNEKTQPRFSVSGLFGPQGEPFPVHLTLRLTDGSVHQEQSLLLPAASSEHSPEKRSGSFAS